MCRHQALAGNSQQPERPFCISGHLYSWRSQQNARMKETKGGWLLCIWTKQKSGSFFAHIQKAIFKFLKRALIAFARRRKFQLPARSISWTGRAPAFITLVKKALSKMKN
jgi:hypothetical protein